jgi:hypothetical protein
VKLTAEALNNFWDTVPAEAKKSGAELVKAQKKTNTELEKDAKKTSDKQLEEFKRLSDEKQKLLDSFNEDETAKTKEAALKDLAVNKAKLEKISLEKQGAKEDTIRLKNEEIIALESLQRLEKENAEIAAKEEKTAIELITREKNIELIKQQEEKLEATLRNQEENDDDIRAEIGDFEERTLELIRKSFDEKLKVREAALKKVEDQLLNINVEGSLPSQEKILDDSLTAQEEAILRSYEDKLEIQEDGLSKIGKDLVDPQQEGSYPSQEKLLEDSLKRQADVTDAFYLSRLELARAYRRKLEKIASGNDPDEEDVEEDDDDSSEETSGGGETGGDDDSIFDDDPIFEESSSAPQVQSSVRTRSSSGFVRRKSNDNESKPQTVNVIVDIELQDNLVNFISAQQRQQTDLGISRQ